MTTPLSFRSIFKEKGSFSNLTVYFALEAFDVALSIGTGTSYLFFLASQSYGSKQSPVSILTLEKKTQCRDEIWLLISCHASHVQPLQVLKFEQSLSHAQRNQISSFITLNLTRSSVWNSTSRTISSMSFPQIVVLERLLRVARYPSWVSRTSPSILYPPKYDLGKKHQGTPCKKEVRLVISVKQGYEPSSLNHTKGAVMIIVELTNMNRE